MRIVFLLFSLFVISAYSQNNFIDSLEKILPTKTGKEKFNVLGELAYQYCFVNTDKALEYGNAELKVAEEIGDSLMIAQAWNDLGAAYASRGELENSIQFTSNALRVREKYGDSLLVANTLNKIGYAYLNMGVLEKSLNAFVRAATIYDRQENYQYLGITFNNIGSVFLRQGNNDKATEYLNKAIATTEKSNDISTLITAKTNLAGILFERGEYVQSEKMYLELIDLIAKSGIKQTLPTITMNLGVCNIQQGKFEGGLKFLLEAEKIYEEKNDHRGLAMVLVNIGNCYVWMKNFPKASEYLEKGKKLYVETASNLQLHFAYEGLYRLENAKGNSRKAIEYFNEARKYENLIQNERTTAKVSEMEVKYQTEKKEKELALRIVELSNEQLKNKKQQLAISLMAVGLLFVLSLIFFVVRNNKLKREKLIQQSKLNLQDERLRISRDLHDNIGAELTLISSSLDAKAYKANDAKEKNELENISEFSRNAMTQLRETIWAIRNENISIDAFAARLREYADKICKPANISSSIILSGENEKTLSPSQTINLYRICQEAIHNSVKYSQSEKLKISIEANNLEIKIAIADNGKGFDISNVPKGYGIKNMKARASEMNGTIQIDSEKEKGTRVLVSIPS